MTRRRIGVVVGTALLLVAAPFGAAVAQSPAFATELAYSIKEARAYAFKASLTKEAIEAAGAGGACVPDPAKPYNDCDKTQYNHDPNCPTPPALGPTGAGPLPASPAGSTPDSGGSGGAAGTDPTGGAPPQANPVRINELLASGRLSHAQDVLESGGFSSDTYVDNDGRQEPEAHTESDGFSPNRAAYEERCWDGDNQVQPNASSFAHFLSRSLKRPETYHFAECVGQQCSRSTSLGIRTSAQRAYSIVHLHEEGGKVFGSLQAFVSGMTFGPSTGTPLVAADSVITYATFESDGSKEGLKWKALTLVSGLKINNSPVTLPQGETVGACPPQPPAPLPAAPCFYVGASGPYVRATSDGKQLTVIAPGLAIANDMQATFIAGGEMYVGLDRVPPFTPPTAVDNFETITTEGSVDIPSFGSSEVIPIAPAAPIDREIKRTVAIEEIPSPPWAPILIVSLGILALLTVLVGWMRRFGWGATLFRLQPLATFDRLYRAFLRT